MVCLQPKDVVNDVMVKKIYSNFEDYMIINDMIYSHGYYDVVNKAVDKINHLLDSFMGINDTELGTCALYRTVSICNIHLLGIV